jgi:CRISPR/Cas system-associated exonuclease Cas4 (RecB family)
MFQHAIEKHLVPLESSAFNYEVKKILTFKLAEQMLGSAVSTVPGKQCAEQWFESADGKVGGMADLVLSHEDGVEIVDYKTGHILDSGPSGEVKEKYQVQMKFYAGLYHEVKGNWPVKLSVIGIDRQKYYISFTQEECVELLNKARKIFDETNELIGAGLEPEDFANPSPALCKYCSYRPACKKYWEEREYSDKWPLDILGEVKKKAVLGNGFCRMLISSNGREFVIRGLSVERHKFLSKNINCVLFCDLGQDTLDGHYVERLLTTGYPLNNEKTRVKEKQERVTEG